jgi:acyl-coenzyme A synthetase/AMP-(fatty) acid ligase
MVGAAEPCSTITAGAEQAVVSAFAGGRPVAYYRGRPIGRDRFLADVQALAEALPYARHIVNLCTNRYRFAVGFCAALLRDQLTLLPADTTIGTVLDLARRYPQTIVLADTAGLELPTPCYFYTDLERSDPAPAGEIAVSGKRAAAVVFTSGSTGKPEGHIKTWNELAQVTVRTASRYGLDPNTHYTVVATVPPQHMYGLESSVVLPLRQGLAIHESRPFFPADLAAVTRRSPEQVVLVTTPIHLRALLNANVELHNTALMISATAPLAAEEAANVEERFNTRVLEVYGSTETCVLATRHPASEPLWRLLDGLVSRATRAGIEFDAPYFDKPRLVQDRLEPLDEVHFRLLGRAADMVKVGGKRTSLAGLSAALRGIDGVEDGVFFMSDGRGAATPRLLAFVVAPGVDSKSLRRRLRKRIDPVFLPRPLVLVESLPRNACGKLTHAALERLAAGSLGAAGGEGV